MNIEFIIKEEVKKAILYLYGQDINNNLVQLQNTRKEFEGDITLVVFPLLRLSKKPPEQTANELGSFLVQNSEAISHFNVVKGFLNLVVVARYWIGQLNQASADPGFGFKTATGESKLVMVEYSSPNTNKPLHLGHIRNNLLGYSICKLLEANGYNVVKTNIVNDRGIHICKSMLAWQKWGNGKTPENTGIKGDHLVGDFYVRFDQEFRKEVEGLMAAGMSKEEAENNAPSLIEARELLRKWEAKDPETVELWKMMNKWVYDGFDVTYKELGVDFDKIYYESETYLAGKEEVLKGLRKGIFYRKEDNSVWADLSEEGLDQKLLLRSDGTSVYMTQDIGTAKMRFDDYPIDKMIYVVGNEQNYHFQVLSILLDKLGFEWGRDLYHFSYGMVELPSGKMKSREGKVVDADDLLEEMFGVAKRMSEELGKLENLSDEETVETYKKIAKGALKYFILKVDPRKNMLFNPEESIDFNGKTGPFIQYTYARIKSVLRKAEEEGGKIPQESGMISNIGEKEKIVLKRIAQFPGVVNEAAENFSPAIVANYCYELVKEFNQFYHDYPILKVEDNERRDFRLVLSKVVAEVVSKSMGLLGIQMPERM
ncbi:Arginyl-tRNA synthetase [hydrothermal vent metagenome]|uniref:arginine--tRNA ligase n=1 Tax=hydrothermal vent metagenome TaxID=652676 RepID=A0A3B0U3B6_9ZZZZ